MSDVVYLDTSAVLRAVLERGLTPDVEQKIERARFLVTSRLALVESARAIARLRHEGVPAARLADAAHEFDAIWSRCTVWELTRSICDLAAATSPALSLRTLDALHLATWLTTREKLGPVELLTTDARLAGAAAAS